jgi:phosphatidylglycerol---prolipoprotein diacylglyceryl transferase
MGILTILSSLFGLGFMAPMAINWTINPEILHFGPIHLRYYGMLFITGFILGYAIFMWFYRREKLPLTLLDPLLYILLGCTLVGARLGHVLFYEPEYYLANPWKIFVVWEGGLASHGGAIAIVFGIWWYARRYGKKYNFDFMWIMDRVGITVAFAGMFIRLGNLMNSEIFGGPTTLPWGFRFFSSREWQLYYGPKIFPPEGLACHPTQLYEALSYMMLGFILIALYKFALPKLKRGLLFGLFLTGLFGARFCIEFIKLPQVEFEQSMRLNMGQILSIPFILVGIFLIIRSFYISTPAQREEIVK